MTKYIIQFKAEIEIDAESAEKAKEAVKPKFDELTEKQIKVSEAKVVHKDTGYFL